MCFYACAASKSMSWLKTQNQWMQFTTYNYMVNWILTWFAFLKISAGGESEEEWEILMMAFLLKL